MTGVRRFVNIRIVPLVSKARECISFQKDGNITTAESDSRCVKSIIASQSDCHNFSLKKLKASEEKSRHKTERKL